MTITEQLKALVIERKADGRVVYYQEPGDLVSMPVAELCDQPADGLLYDLNRDEASILAFAGEDNPYWVNNYATALVIRYLKGRVEELERAISEKEEAMQQFVSSIKEEKK